MAATKKKIRKVPEDDFGIWLEKNRPDFVKGAQEAGKKKPVAKKKKK